MAEYPCTCTHPHLCDEAQDLWDHLWSLPHDGAETTAQIRAALALQLVEHWQAAALGGEERPHHGRGRPDAAQA